MTPGPSLRHDLRQFGDVDPAGGDYVLGVPRQYRVERRDLLMQARARRCCGGRPVRAVVLPALRDLARAGDPDGVVVPEVGELGWSVVDLHFRQIKNLADRAVLAVALEMRKARHGQKPPATIITQPSPPAPAFWLVTPVPIEPPPPPPPRYPG
jgi:hypothetical protein